MSEKAEAGNDWDAIADEYQSRYGHPSQDFDFGPLAPGDDELDLLGPLAGQRVLDLGCGGGQNCRALHRAGALVTGVDSSGAQLRFARRRCSDMAIEFFHARAEDLSELSDSSFDLIVSVYLFSYVEQIELTLEQCRRLLAPGGRLVFSLDHPIRVAFWDRVKQSEGVLPVRRYDDEEPLQWVYPDSSTELTTYPRSIGRWVHLLGQANFRLLSLIETPLPAGWEEEPWADEYTIEVAPYLPQTLIIEAETFRTGFNE